ncbi:poly(3-hydroxybutyrate) depolymerase [Bdellovibrio sp. HCB337]|uniref:extracellular catalytic domain type 2 short-chain-length polyhydroxyalkanoate depolymerase n=1 Tax=Bdellovibrio sp. HCB337 TaxID=3394358 RepID=UPI0039A56B4C
MAVQLGVAFSSQIKGIAAIAGGIYGCSGGIPALAINICMKNPAVIEPQQFADLTQAAYGKKLIDDPANLAQQRVFILNGTDDETVLPIAGRKLEEFYQKFHATPRTEFGLEMGHGFPSNKGKNKCSESAAPWLNHCDYHGAKEILETFYGPLKAASEESNSENLLVMDQIEFANPLALMATQGHIYIPKTCRAKGSHCRLHIALHGCRQSPSAVGDAFVWGSGYNEWADRNKIVVLYPAARVSLMNPNGCWDWFGYTGNDYAFRSSRQMTAIMNMVQHLTRMP